MDLQPQKIVPPNYNVTVDDNGWVLLASGDVVFPFGLPSGFYVTILNLRGAVVNLVAPNATVRSPNGGTSLSAANTSVTVLRVFNGNDIYAFGI